MPPGEADVGFSRGKFSGSKGVLVNEAENDAPLHRLGPLEGRQ